MKITAIPWLHQKIYLNENNRIFVVITHNKLLDSLSIDVKWRDRDCFITLITITNHILSYSFFTGQLFLIRRIHQIENK